MKAAGASSRLLTTADWERYILRQCQLLKIAHSSLYYQAKDPSDEELTLLRLIDQQYLETPVLWQPQNDGVPSRAGLPHQSQTNAAEDGKHLNQEVKQWFDLYNQERFHQALRYKTSNQVYYQNDCIEDAS
jgi:transposase InsO family protein